MKNETVSHWVNLNIFKAGDITVFNSFPYSLRRYYQDFFQRSVWIGRAQEIGGGNVESESFLFIILAVKLSYLLWSNV